MKKLIFQDLKNAINQKLLMGCPVVDDRFDDVHSISNSFSICFFTHVVKDARTVLIEFNYLGPWNICSPLFQGLHPSIFQPFSVAGIHSCFICFRFLVATIVYSPSIIHMDRWFSWWIQRRMQNYDFDYWNITWALLGGYVFCMNSQNGQEYILKYLDVGSNHNSKAFLPQKERWVLSQNTCSCFSEPFNKLRLKKQWWWQLTVFMFNKFLSIHPTIDF